MVVTRTKTALLLRRGRARSQEQGCSSEIPKISPASAQPMVGTLAGTARKRAARRASAAGRRQSARVHPRGRDPKWDFPLGSRNNSFRGLYNNSLRGGSRVISSTARSARLRVYGMVSRVRGRQSELVRPELSRRAACRTGYPVAG